jgi:NADH-quinone oxidoreductase subunit A
MTSLTYAILIFLGVGVFFLFIHLALGKLLRPIKPDAEKMTIYECGEPTIGSAWVQFDVRYYVVALLFVIFDVEVAFFFPWAVVFGTSNKLADPALPDDQRAALTRELIPAGIPAVRGAVGAEAVIPAETAQQVGWIAFADIAVFFGVLLVGFAYLWKRGDLDWVRTTASERQAEAAVAEVDKDVLVSNGQPRIVAAASTTAGEGVH